MFSCRILTSCGFGVEYDSSRRSLQPERSGLSNQPGFGGCRLAAMSNSPLTANNELAHVRR